MSSAGQIVRLKKGKQVFEVITNEGSVLKYREGNLGWDKVLVTDVIFKNSSKGDQANETDLESAFDTSDHQKILQSIVEKGDLQVSAAERKEALEKKKKELLGFLHKNFIDPKTNLPHPMVRLEQALENSKYRVDADGPVAKQSQELIKALLGKLSFLKSEIEGTLLSKPVIFLSSPYSISSIRRFMHQYRALYGGYQERGLHQRRCQMGTRAFTWRF